MSTDTCTMVQGKMLAASDVVNYARVHSELTLSLVEGAPEMFKGAVRLVVFQCQGILKSIDPSNYQWSDQKAHELLASLNNLAVETPEQYCKASNTLSQARKLLVLLRAGEKEAAYLDSCTPKAEKAIESLVKTAGLTALAAEKVLTSVTATLKEPTLYIGSTKLYAPIIRPRSRIPLNINEVAGLLFLVLILFIVLRLYVLDPDLTSIPYSDNYTITTPSK